jgi:glycosyltransferase involved in cell wall biosynthesis
LKKDFSQLKSIIPKKLVPFSVIISARNEARNLIEYLPSILEQDYPTFEVIIIDDNSTDDTSKILNHFKGQYAHLQIIKIEHKKSAGKKEGLQQGIMNAKYEWLVFTDADCYPKSDQWLRKMATKCDKKTDIILGYSPYQKENGLLNDFIRYETFMTAVIYGTFTQLGMPYMGVGRNMAYRKSRFLEKVNKEKFEIGVKSIAKTIAAVTIVAIGVRLLTVYLTNELDLISIIAGILGILILQPTIRHYTRLINLLFPDNIKSK